MENIDFSDENFESSSAIFVPSQTFLDWAKEAKAYLAGNPKKVVTITGHTDSTGAASSNKKLGLNRAKAVKAFLVGNGVTATIKVDSKGETEPLESNQTKEGRQKNRRVNITIK